MDHISTICASCGRVMGSRLQDVLLIAILLVCSTQAVMRVNLAQLLHNRASLPHYEHKRGSKTILRADDQNHDNPSGGNPCEDYPDHPFPCKNTEQCLPFRYVCDNNFDCDDNSDEEIAMCTASKRPPVDELKKFLQKEKSWMFPVAFPGKTIDEVAKALAVSPTIYEMMDELNWDYDHVDGLVSLLEAIKFNEEDVLQQMGMPLGDWPEVSYMFMNLMESGLEV